MDSDGARDACAGVRWAELQAMASALKASAPQAFREQFGEATDADLLITGMVDRELIRPCPRHSGFFIAGACEPLPGRV